MSSGKTVWVTPGELRAHFSRIAYDWVVENRTRWVSDVYLSYSQETGDYVYTVVIGPHYTSSVPHPGKTEVEARIEVPMSVFTSSYPAAVREYDALTKQLTTMLNLQR